MAIKSSQTLVSEALKEIKTISIDDAFKKFNDNQCNLIDIRDIRELQNEGTHGRFTPASQSQCQRRWGGQPLHSITERPP